MATFRLAFVLLLLAGCGTRTDLGKDAGRFVDDDPWLKIDAAAPRGDAGVNDASDARLDGRG
jgi:hypothetical protein